jgi:hypothetical protein
MATATTLKRDWIAAEFSKGIAAEQRLIAKAKARADSPPDPTFQVLYNEIAAADARHLAIVETIAARYGHPPNRGATGGVVETLGRLREKVAELGSSPTQLVAHDLAAKADAIHWYVAWLQAFEALGDAESARELAALLSEEKAHRDALQEGLNRLVVLGATGPGATPDDE